MTSHHFIGTGFPSESLRVASRDPERLLGRIAGLVSDGGLEVMAQQAVPFDNGGLTLVWVLAESHLVLHLWPEEGYATVDLHVCDYRTSNAEKARRLREELNRLCFAGESGEWREMAVGAYPPMEFPGSHYPVGIHQERKGGGA